MINFKELIKHLYKDENYSAIEQTSDGKYIFYPTPFHKGFEVDSLKDLTPILAYYRLSAVFDIFFIMTLSVILVIFLHQMINMSCFFTITILTICITTAILSRFFMWYLKKFKKVPPKIKMGTKTKITAGILITAIILVSLCFIGSCPCLFYGHNLENQEWQKALNTINFYLKLQPKNDNLYENRAIAKYNLNDIDGAIKDCDKAIEINPKNQWAISGKAYFMFVKGRKITPEINALLKKSIQLTDKYPIGYSDRAKIYYLLGKSDKAIEDFEQAYLKSGNEFFNYLSAVAYEQKGDYCKAFAYYNTVPQNKHFQILELPMKKEYAKFMCKE